MTSDAKTVEEYLATLSGDKLDMVMALRKVMLDNLQPGFEEGMQYGGIGYFVPHSIYPSGYHCDPKQPLPFAGIMAQKNHVGWYGFCIYTEDGAAERFREACEATGRKLDMGKACVRFKKMESIPLDVIGQTVREISVEVFVSSYEKIKPKKK